MNNVITFGYGSNIILRQTQLNSLQRFEFACNLPLAEIFKAMMEYCELFSKELFIRSPTFWLWHSFNSIISFESGLISSKYLILYHQASVLGIQILVASEFMPKVKL